MLAVRIEDTYQPQVIEFKRSLGTWIQEPLCLFLFVDVLYPRDVTDDGLKEVMR